MEAGVAVATATVGEGEPFEVLAVAPQAMANKVTAWASTRVMVRARIAAVLAIPPAVTGARIITPVASITHRMATGIDGSIALSKGWRRRWGFITRFA